MIERTTSRLEIGGQLIRRIAKISSRSRRCLHSSFWSHGAGNIDLPSWWIYFLQTTDFDKECHAPKNAHLPAEKISGAIQELFLDFLYPVQTLALIRRLRRSTVVHQFASQSLKHCYRNYTSIAEDVITGVGVVESEAAVETPATPEVGRTVEEIRENIDGILSKADLTGFYDQLWHDYQDLLEKSETLSYNELLKMLRSLTKSKRTVDMERLVALFESIPVQQRRAIHYSCTVSAALTLKDLGIAIVIHEEARGRVRGSIGTSAILAYTVQHERWQEAVEIWHPLWIHKLAYFTTPELWSEVHTLPLTDLMDKAASAADFAISATESVGYDAAAPAREFALELVRIALKRHQTSFDANVQWKMLEKARMLDVPNPKIEYTALSQLLSFQSREHEHHVLRLYQRLRKDSKFSPNQGLLKAITKSFIAQKYSPGMFMMIDDWKKYHDTYPPRHAKAITMVLAQNGELEATQKLFRDFFSKHGKPKTPDLYFAMLHVYNRRIDTTGIVQMWDELRRDYEFEPDVKAFNIVISTFTRGEDVNGAMAWFQKLREAGAKPNSRTFGSLMALHGKRGDWDAVDELFQMSKVEGVEPDKSMIDSLVTAAIKDERLEEAEKIVVEAMKMPVEGSRNFMWNALLNAYAWRKDVNKVTELHRQMEEAGVASDSMTYAALMTALTILKQPDAARKILRRVMPGANVNHTTIHYAILMRGYLFTKQYTRVCEIYEEMLGQNLAPTMSTQNVLLRAAASVDRESQAAESEPGEKIMYTLAQQTFDQALANLDPMELALSEPRMYMRDRPINEAFSANYFEYLIFLYGTDGAFDKVSALFDSYVKTVTKYTNEDIESNPPIRLLSALMATHLRDKDYPEIDRCWNLAFSKAQQLARKSTESDTSSPEALGSRRFILSRPLSLYITALKTQNRISNLIATISSLHSAGFSLTSPNWNAYIGALATSPSPTHQAYAFQLCEQELMPYWPGWKSLRDPQYMVQNKFAPINRATHLILQKRMPGYIMFVKLARAYLLAKKRRGGEPSVRSLVGMAPRTVDTVINMPRLEDAPQTLILRGGGGLISRPVELGK